MTSICDVNKQTYTYTRSFIVVAVDTCAVRLPNEGHCVEFYTRNAWTTPCPPLWGLQFGWVP